MILSTRLYELINEQEKGQNLPHLSIHPKYILTNILSKSSNKISDFKNVKTKENTEVSLLYLLLDKNYDKLDAANCCKGKSNY